jgi:hypothetical protein
VLSAGEPNAVAGVPTVRRPACGIPHAVPNHELNLPTISRFSSLVLAFPTAFAALSPGRGAAARVILTAVFVALGAAELPAQNSVLLRLRPRLGDTLHMRLEQQIEMRSQSPDQDEDRVLSSSVRVRARAIPTRLSGGATIITTITDSLLVHSPVLPVQQMEQARRSVLGRPVEVRVRPDGSMEVLNRDGHVDESSPLLGSMPAVLPAVEVSPGDQWVREMTLPVRGTRDSPAYVRATFRLDSLGRGGQIAYISVRGVFQERSPGGASRPMEGTLIGAIEFDRDLGWIRDMRTTVTTRSEVRLPDPRLRPLAVLTRITQRLQARTIP